MHASSGLNRMGKTWGWLAILLLVPPLAAQAQFRFTTNNGTITLAKYTGPGGAVVIPATVNGRRVTHIGHDAFAASYHVTRVTIPNTVTHIDSNAFESCFSLQSVYIPDSVRSLGGFAFWSCGRMTSARIGGGLSELKIGTFGGCRSLRSIAIPAGITNIDYAAFLNCSGLAQVAIPHAVRNIGGDAFNSCTGLQSVLIGKGVEEIWLNAFKNCPRLTSVCFQGNPPRLLTGWIFDGSPLARIYHLPWTTGWRTSFSGRPTKAGDAYEPDNSASAAKVIVNGQTQIHCIHAAGNEDWVKFAVGGAGGRNLVLETAGVAGDTQLWLYKGSGALVAYDDNSGAGNFSRIARTTLPPGTYYAKVREYGNNGLLSFFTLKATWTSP